LAVTDQHDVRRARRDRGGGVPDVDHEAAPADERPVDVSRRDPEVLCDLVGPG
jgi:hypothetical protein